MLVLLQRFRHRYLFSHLSSFGAVNQVVPSLCLSCSGHAWMRMLLHMILGLFLIQRMQSPLSGLFFAFYLPFPLAFPLVGVPIAGLSSSRFLAFTWESLIFCSRCLWAINFNLAIITLLVANCRLLSVDLQQVFQSFRLVNSYLVQTLQYAVSRSVSDCWSHFIPLRVEVLNVVVL